MQTLKTCKNIWSLFSIQKCFFFLCFGRFVLQNKEYPNSLWAKMNKFSKWQLQGREIQLLWINTNKKLFTQILNLEKPLRKGKIIKSLWVLLERIIFIFRFVYFVYSSRRNWIMQLQGIPRFQLTWNWQSRICDGCNSCTHWIPYYEKETDFHCPFSFKKNK